MNKVFLHVDLDAFFASVEQLDHPEYRGKPVIVGGLPGDRRSVVSTASYEARKFGVHSAMPTFQAVKLCPHGIFLRGRMKRYHEKSEEVMAIFREYSPDIQQISVDEAFIDLTGTERLFGDPVETAKRLKAEVLEKTGLTVSVGIASTKYCAKIASGLQKPDGLTAVPFGGETEFMLSLPITKVWGAGNKTLAKLESYGIRTTRDIYMRSEKLLQSLFGKAAGTFLYNSVRGNAGADFRAEPKSRSISAENTYEYDLTNPDIIETALLSLCHTVMFRSLREKVRSRSVSLKIRYEDFSTVSVQSASERYVSSVDDLFERAKALLEKKRDTKSGIRLLGVGLYNLEDEKTPRQQELFDFGEEKKRRLENAILKAQEKDPALKITKARLLGGTALTLAMIFLPIQGVRADTQKEADGAAGIVFDTSRLPLSDSGDFVSLFNKDFGDQNLEFFAEGYWKSTVTGGANYSFGFGKAPVLTTNTPVFAQNVDLSLYFMLNHHWYFEASFADKFTKNTVAAGYVGDGYLKSARISNRKIIFPSIYSVDEVNRGIGGGDNQAPGISFNWKGLKWQADAAMRYDLLEAHEKTWYGKNSVSVNEIPLSNYNTGSQYILPSSNLVQNIKAVYVESASGRYRDSKGRKYKKLDGSQYLLLAGQNQILLSKDARAFRQNGVLPAVAVTFWGSLRQSDFGDFDDETTFLGKVQKWFSKSGQRNLSLKKYSYPIFNSINGEDCLFLQHPAGFSPFVVASRYDCGSQEAGDAQIADSVTGTADSGYSVVIDEDKLRFSQADFFYSNHLYADVSLSEDDEADSLEKLIHASFPLARLNPQIYLGGSSFSEKVLQVRSFSPVNRLEIGGDAVSGSVTVYKNGVIDGSAKYDSESGTITLSSAVAASDHIVARWYEESEDSESGAFSAAAGFKYDFTENLSADLSASGRWGYSPDREFADSSYSSQGFATLAGKASYTGDNFSFKNTAALTYENTNTTGNFRILGNDDKESESYYLSKKAGINLPDGFEPVLNEKTSGGISRTELKAEKNSSLEASEGKSDPEISGYAIPFEWDFSGMTAGSENDSAWSALSLYTPGVEGILGNASNFSIALKKADSGESFDGTNCALYLQLGVSADDDFSIEEAERIPTWKISDSGSDFVRSSFDFSKSGWQIVKVTLSDEDRSIISSLQNFNARLILTASNTSSLPVRGTIYAGPYEAGELVFNTESEAALRSENYQAGDLSLSSSKIKKFNKNSSNKVQVFDWKFDEEQTEAQKIIFSRNFREIDLGVYKKLSFFLKFKTDSEDSSVTIRLTRPKSGGGQEEALVYTIPKKNLSALWQEYEIDLTGSKDSLLKKIDTNIVPTSLEIIVTTKENGSLSFDELYLSENTPFFVAQDKIEAGYKIDGAILETENLEILKDFKIEATGNGAAAIESENGTNKEKNLQSTGSIGFTLANLKIGGQAALSNAYRNAKSDQTEQKNTLSSASHFLETEKPILNILSFSENYSFSSADGSLEKENGAKIDFSGHSIPLALESGTKARSDSWSLSQDAGAKISFRPQKLSFTAESRISQKIPASSQKNGGNSGSEKFSTENYGSSWCEITEFSFDTGSEKAQKRAVTGKSSLACSFDRANLKPEIFFETEGNYKSSAKVTFSDSTKSGFIIPFSLAKNNFSFSWKKSTGSTNPVETGGSYERDAGDLQKSLGEKSYYFAVMPIYDLASTNLAKKVQKTDRESNFYTGNYAFNWRRAFFASKYDFFIPISAKLEATRDIRTGDNLTDFYQIKGTVTNTALNIFGRNGSLPILSIFESDEYNSSLSAAVKVPRTEPGDYSYLVSGYFQATFFFTEKNYVKSGFEGSLEGKDDWKAKCTLVWKREAKSSLARGLVSIFSEKAAGGTKKITKTDSLNMAAAKTSSTSSMTKKYSIDYMHETETQVSKFVSLNTDFGLGYSATWDKIALLSATATLGATIRF